MKLSRYYASLIAALLLFSPLAAAETFPLQRAGEGESTVVQVSPDVYFKQGWVKFIAGEYQEAIKNFTQVIKLNPRNADAYYVRGAAYTSLGNYQQAITDYDRAIGLRPKFAEAYFSRGAALIMKGEYHRAISNHNLAIRLRPKFADAYALSGVAYQKIGDTERAISNWRKAANLFRQENRMEEYQMVLDLIQKFEN